MSCKSSSRAWAIRPILLKEVIRKTYINNWRVSSTRSLPKLNESGPTRTTKGWTCPPEIDGKKCEDYWRSHQVPMGDMDKPEHIRILEKWMKSYRPEELFGKDGRLKPEIAELAPQGHRRMSDNPHANGGLLMRDLKMPDFRKYAVSISSPGATNSESARVMGTFLRDVMKLNLESENFRLFSPDENNSNRWQDVLDVTTRCYMAEIYDT